MKKRISLVPLAALALLLMAFQCEDDKQTLFGNELKARFSEEPNLSVGDTLWISGRVSANVYDSELRDSVFDPNFDFVSQFSLSKLIRVSTDRTNEIEIGDALGDFVRVNRTGTSNTFGCTGSELTINTVLPQDASFYTYEIGLVPQNSGDYILHFYSGTQISNTNRNLSILGDYPTGASNPNLTCRDCCRGFSLDVQATEGDFLFSVE
jgi:hypothetical protein